MMRAGQNITVSEREFEIFLNSNSIEFERVPVAKTRTPDYLVSIGEFQVYFEVKELSEDEDFTLTESTRTVGDHVRAKIMKARKQIKFGANLGVPSVLLIYNDIDPSQRFGTENHDFEHAMYGERTVCISGTPPKIIDSFHGGNAKLVGMNTSFSAVGRLATDAGKPNITLFENIYAAHKLPFEALPPCFTVIRVEIVPAP